MNRNRPAVLSTALLAVLSILASAPDIAAQDRAPTPSSEEDALYFLLFGDAPPEESPDDMLIVSEISVECPSNLDVEYVLSFIGPVREGDTLRAGELDALLKLDAQRMSLSNMFYSSSATYERLEPEAGEDGLIAVRVLVKASEGFWWGFGFSPWDLSIGYRNLGGAGKELAAIMGLNTQALLYRDTSISYGPLYWSAEAWHLVDRRSGAVDPSCLYEDLGLAAEFGTRIGDDLSIGLALGYRAFRSPEEYFLYPGYESPSDSALSALGVTRSASSLVSAGARADLGSYSYKKRGGIKATASFGIDGLASSLGGWEIVPRATALGLLRLDAPALLRLSFRERITWIPKTADAGIPQALWASAEELRCPSGLISGELASVSRVGLELDRVAAIGLGFAELGVVPELFYEFGAVSRSAYGDEARTQQDIGFLVKFAASQPVGRTFAFGVALGLAGESESETAFVFEIQ